MEPFTVFLIVVITVLTVLLVVTGIQVILILRQVSQTLSHLNKTVGTVDTIVNKVANPLSNMGSVTKGVKAGLDVADHVVLWFKKKHQDKDSYEPEPEE